MLLIMGVTLYTSRVILKVLGVEDFGIYNVVGGVVMMMSFFNSSLTTATQRFLNFEMGKGNKEDLKKIFSISLICYFLIAIVVFIIAETVGLWFVHNKLIIPDNRLQAAIIVFHISIMIFVFNILTTSYSAVIIANERMDFYAYVSIVEVVLKLILVYVLTLFHTDKLIVYGVLMLFVSILTYLIYWKYCTKHFAECCFIWDWDVRLLKRLFSFSGWMLIGTMTNLLSTQGVNMLINIYFGPLLNAARAIAIQVNGAISSFAVNFMTATRPQIVKSYAQQDYEHMYKLVFSSSKLSFGLLFLLSLPVLLDTEYLLKLWLNQVPDHVVVFTRLVIIDLLITSSYSPVATISQASGRIKAYQLIISVGFILVFLLSWFLFNWGYPVTSTFYLSIVISAIGFYARIYELKRSHGFPLKSYFFNVIIPVIITFILAIVVLLLLKTQIIYVDSLFSLVVNNVLYFIVNITIIWFVMFDYSEKEMVKKLIEKIKK